MKMVFTMDIEQFVKKQQSALKKFQRTYILFDFAVISFIVYTLLYIFNMDTLFSIISAFELYTGSIYQLIGYSIPFETFGLIVAAIFISLLITIIFHIRDKRLNAIFLVEESEPTLHERLRTAYDNRKNHNIIIDGLISSVMSDAIKVKSSSFLNKRRVALGIIALLLTSSSSAYVTTTDYRTDISPIEISQIIEELPIPFMKNDEEVIPDMFPNGDEDGENGEESDEGGSENLFGEPAIIVIEGEEIDLTLPPGAGIGFSGSTEGEIRTEEFERSSAYDISVISSQAYYESLPEGYDNIIKAYFEEMAQ